ncbi:MAG: helix-turn-helix domain-containing protein [Sphaerochaeta sp.]|nr:helix-turn-helix domain-containing protein [Sphaerochaeta sp.]
MQRNDPTEFYEALCSSFPQASVFAVNSEGEFLFDRYQDHNRWASYCTVSYRKEATTVLFGDQSFYKIGLPFNETLQFFIFMQENSFSDVFIPANMVDSLAKMVASLQREVDKSNQYPFQSDYALFLDQLFYASSASHITYTSLLAAKLGIDLSLHRLVCLIHVQDREGKPLVSSQLFYALIRTIKTNIASRDQDIIGLLGSSRIVYCPYVAKGFFSREKLENQLRILATTLMHTYSISVSISVGLYAQHVLEYGQSLRLAQSVLRYDNSTIVGCLVFAEDHLVEYMLQVIPKPVLDHFLGYWLQYLQDNPVVYETLHALVCNDMDIYSTARQLHVHRNTVVFRIEQIKSAFSLDPLHQDSDRFKLILIYTYARNLLSKEQ